MKKLLYIFGAVAVILVMAPIFAAFEAHVVNLTATIENALSVPIEKIVFGTVFPQEELDQQFDIALSDSFVAEDRVDDIEYIIRQKPKCGLPIPDTDPVEYSAFGLVTESGENEEEFVCADEGFVKLPVLCPYLSKHELTDDGIVEENDSDGISAFHGLPGEWTLGTTRATEVRGRLAKLEEDLSDIWNVDLKVPCFGNHCAQDWASFVGGINETANAEDYIQPEELEHELFGCDLWVEVTGVSLPGIGCEDRIDLMLVLDRSGSISSTELSSLKTAAKAFANALSPSADTAHIGQTSFSTTGTLDLHLTGDIVAIEAAIDGIIAGGFTNLMEGIDLAAAELDNPGDGHDRADFESPDFMVIITDGSPNEPGTDTEAQNAAKAAADAAKADGIEIFVLGVGTTSGTADYLRDNIASGADHYFDVANFSDLEVALESLLQCAND